MKLRKAISRDIAADISVNLAAAWLAAAFIVPNFSGRSLAENILVLILDGAFAIVFAGIAYWLKTRINDV